MWFFQKIMQNYMLVPLGGLVPICRKSWIHRLCKYVDVIPYSSWNVSIVECIYPLPSWNAGNVICILTLPSWYLPNRLPEYLHHRPWVPSLTDSPSTSPQTLGSLPDGLTEYLTTDPGYPP